MMKMHLITSCRFSSGDEYFLLNNNEVRMPIEAVEGVYDSPPFPREKIRVLIQGTEVTRNITDNVSYV